MSEAISLLGESKSSLAGLAGDVLVAIQHDLCREWRMAAYFDGEVSPLSIENVEGIVVDIGHRLLSLDVVISADIPHRRLRPPDQDDKHALGDSGPGEIVLCDVVLAIAR